VQAASQAGCSAGSSGIPDQNCGQAHAEEPAAWLSRRLAFDAFQDPLERQPGVLCAGGCTAQVRVPIKGCEPISLQISH
jgi:hypothetical protein